MWLINIARQAAFDAIRSAQALGTSEESKKLFRNISAFDLVYYKGLSYIETAAVLKIPVEEVIINMRMKLKELQDKNVTT